jgi:hypothetical protein
MLAETPMRWLKRILPLVPVAFYGCSDPSAPVARRMDARVHALAAPVITVTNTDDSGAGSLRQAMFDATPGTVIQFDPAIAGQTIVLSGVLKGASAYTIEGPVPKGITISGNLTTQVFEVFNNADLVLRNLSIVNGRDVEGAGIQIDKGTVTLDHVLVANNEASANGGGIALTDPAAQLVLVNTTVSGNIAGFGGGGIASQGSVIIRNSTITSNIAAAAGGLYGNNGSLSLRNSIIAGNVDNDATNLVEPNCHFEPSLNLVYSGANQSNDDTCGAAPTITIGDPNLGPLADNGGPTKTHALPSLSSAIDAGALCTESTDQRYVQRNQGLSCDLGAFEFNDFGTFTFTIGPNIAINAKTGVATVTGTIKCSKLGSATLTVGLSQTQKTTGRFTTIIQGTAGTNVALCSTTPSSWSASVTPGSGKFENGTATATVTTAIFPVGFLEGNATASVKVYAVK